MSEEIWRQIESLLAGADDRALLIAPFIKAPIFEAALATISTEVSEITCITRWSAEEVAAGVSDLEILDVAHADGRPEVRLCHSLHGKLFVSDDQCLVGSANLTAKATGKAESANLELLVETSVSDPWVERFLREVLAQSQLATAEIAANVKARAELLVSNGLVFTGADRVGGEGRRWFPVTRAPERLFRVYLGDSTGCSDAVLEGALTDLAWLDLPPGLNERQFNATVVKRIYSFPEVAALGNSGRISSGELERALLSTGAGSRVDAAERALAVTRWLVHFDPDLHTVRAGPYDIVRGRHL